MTLNHILKTLIGRGPTDVRVCTLLDKTARRIVDVRIDYMGFAIPDVFVVGYGMDYEHRYRGLPFIGVLNREILAR